MKTIGWSVFILAWAIIISAIVIAGKGPLTGTESIVISQITMDQAGNCTAQYQVTFSGDTRYNRYGSVNFNSAATKQLVSDALVQAIAQEGLQ